MMVKLPRKNIVSMIEAEQVKLNGLIDKARSDIKLKVKDLISLGPDLSSEEMDPFVIQLLLRESNKAKVNK